MSSPKDLILLAMAMVTTGMVMTGPCLAEDWPVRPVTMVVTFAAGSGDDLLARIISPRLSQLLGQQVVIENVGGAGGMTGANRVARALPDGYQFVLGGTGTFAANQTLYKHPAYDALMDFKPVVLIAEQPLALIVRKDLPIGNFHEFMSYAKANQTTMQFGSGGAGSATHLACVLLNSAIGIDVTHVPYRSAAIALQDLLAGRLDYLCPIVSTAISQMRGHQVKPLAVLSKGRTSIFPNLASAHEQGLSNFDAYIWNGIFLPRDAPAETASKLHDATVMAMDDPAVLERVKEMGGAIVGPERRSPAYLRQFVDSEIKKWGTPIKASGVSMD
jgi:tripartite-type tricarboxylate transporter receptor subunit TctC